MFESAEIDLGDPENAFGQEMEVSVILGGASSFVTYDADN